MKNMTTTTSVTSQIHECDISDTRQITDGSESEPIYRTVEVNGVKCTTECDTGSRKTVFSEEDYVKVEYQENYYQNEYLFVIILEIFFTLSEQ